MGSWDSTPMNVICKDSTLDSANWPFPIRSVMIIHNLCWSVQCIFCSGSPLNSCNNEDTARSTIEPEWKEVMPNIIC
jgi:hypothetical protein